MLTTRLVIIRSPLARAAAGSFLLRAFSLGAGLVASVALARLSGVEAYGVFAIVSAWVTLLTVPSLLGFDRLLVRELAGEGAERRSGGRGLLRVADRIVLVTSIAAAAGVAALSWVAADDAPGATLAVIVGALSVPFLALGQLRQAALQGLHHVLRGQLGDGFVRPFVLLVLAGGAFVLGIREPGPVAATAMLLVSSVAGAAAAAVLLGRARRDRGDIEAGTPTAEAWLRRAVPLSLIAVLSIVVVQADVVLVGLLATPADAGVYQVAARGSTLVSLPLAVLTAAFAPWFASLWSAGDRAGLQRLVTVTAAGATVVTLVIAVAFVLAGDRFLALFGPGFEAGTRPLALLSIGLLLNTVLGPTAIVLVMTGHERDAALTAVVGVVAEVGLALLLIPRMGLDGAAIASAGGLLAWSVVLVVAVRRRLGIRPTALGI